MQKQWTNERLLKIRGQVKQNFVNNQAIRYRAERTEQWRNFERFASQSITGDWVGLLWLRSFLS